MNIFNHRVMRRLGAAVVVAAMLVPTMTSAATLKIATLAPDGSVWMNQFKAAGESIATATEGRVNLRFYPGGVMGDTATVLRKMQVGQLNGAAVTLGELHPVVSDAQIYNLPFLFRSTAEFEQVRAAVDPDLAAALANKNLVLGGTSNAGFVYLFSLHPATTADDLAAQGRVWIPQGDIVSQRTLEEAGISAIPLPMSQVYTSLQTGMIDTVINTPAAAIALQWHSRVRYMLDLPLALGVGAMVYDQRSMQKMSAEDRQIVIDTTREAMLELEQQTRIENQNARAALESAGIKILQADAGSLQHWEEVAHRVRHQLLQQDKLSLPSLPTVESQLDQLRTDSARNAP
ncbi:MAG: TRAP transporter substrate-binding protein [Wenzhouxiangellaceae bacterium]